MTKQSLICEILGSSSLYASIKWLVCSATSSLYTSGRLIRMVATKLQLWPRTIERRLCTIRSNSFVLLNSHRTSFTFIACDFRCTTRHLPILESIHRTHPVDHRTQQHQMVLTDNSHLRWAFLEVLQLARHLTQEEARVLYRKLQEHLILTCRLMDSMEAFSNQAHRRHQVSGLSFFMSSI
jgi:hypothetical protein